jgi:hypothetical protein
MEISMWAIILQENLMALVDIFGPTVAIIRASFVTELDKVKANGSIIMVLYMRVNLRMTLSKDMVDKYINQVNISMVYS